MKKKLMWYSILICIIASNLQGRLIDDLEQQFNELKKELSTAWSENIRLAKALHEAHKAEREMHCKFCQLVGKG